MFVIKLIFVMGCGWGYGNYRNKNESEGPLFIFSIFHPCVTCLFFLFFWGYFGVGSGTHYMYSRGDDNEMMRIL